MQHTSWVKRSSYHKFSTDIYYNLYWANSKGWVRKTTTEGTYPAGPGHTCGQLAVILQPKNPKDENISNQENNLIKLIIIINDKIF